MSEFPPEELRVKVLKDFTIFASVSYITGGRVIIINDNVSSITYDEGTVLHLKMSGEPIFPVGIVYAVVSTPQWCLTKNEVKSLIKQGALEKIGE